MAPPGASPSECMHAALLGLRFMRRVVVVARFVVQSFPTPADTSPADRDVSTVVHAQRPRTQHRGLPVRLAKDSLHIQGATLSASCQICDMSTGENRGRTSQFPPSRCLEFGKGPTPCRMTRYQIRWARPTPSSVPFSSSFSRAQGTASVLPGRFSALSISMGTLDRVANFAPAPSTR